MSDVEIGRFVRSATAVHRAGRDLQDALAAGEGHDDAADRLARSIESGLADLKRVETGFFEAPAHEAERTTTDPETLLAVVAGQLRLGEVALAAGAATGETEQTTPTLDTALADLRSTTLTLDEPARHQAFAQSRLVSHDLPEAVETLRERLGGTLDAIATGTADVVAGPLKSIAGKAPAQWKEAWDKVSKQLFLDNIGGRLVRLGLRALSAALDALRRLVDATWLETARDRLVALADRAGEAGAGAALLGGVIGAERAREEADTLLTATGLDLGRLDGGTEALAALADRFDSVIGKLALAQAAVGGIFVVQGHFGLAVPWLPLALLGAELLIGAVAVVLAIDYIDTTVSVGRVRGARLILQDAARTA
ncbi:hypothetical protein Ais01nite_22460 [Asanoa ishikariensis]|uniref:Uncharacterized protein n=1 Tax=Asanoa ishikariensis TaxID=137265 RepID=A0A1H3RAW9_9ACTN|nr:hypothetical protein [Asanoa ishikariensis]GIF64211.1 hypothetical protein Ais01nite_22460 [Asanoa ishikariensis]SDZ22817.1 hypothetical protein SAMN05421684_3665 [Asanoa ishikariensis]